MVDNPLVGSATKNNKAYHKIKSRQWFERMQANPQLKLKRNQLRTKQRQLKKQSWVVKFGSKCYDCGHAFPDCVFEFHHLDPQTKTHTDPSKVFMFSDKRIEDELSKCIMLCANCHRIRHYNEGYTGHSKRKYG